MTPETVYRNRRAVQLENDDVLVTVTVEGGHIAEILHKASGVNPLWSPPWPSIEPSTYDPVKHPEYGQNAESQLLAGIMGHNTCLHVFGAPSDEEAEAGVGVHGEASVLPYQIAVANGVMTCSCHLPLAQIRFVRKLRLEGSLVQIEESVENLSAWDQPIAWTQHVTLGPPFLERGKTRFDVTARRSRTYDGDFGNLFDRAVEFEWPLAPVKDGGAYDLQVYSDRDVSACFTTHLMEPSKEQVRFTASNGGVSFGYRWSRNDFPWLGIWEENHSRTAPPWNGRTMTRGMEFGASPQPEPRRAMIERNSLWGVPAYKWLPARKTLQASYEAFIGYTDDLAK